MRLTVVTDPEANEMRKLLWLIFLASFGCAELFDEPTPPCPPDQPCPIDPTPAPDRPKPKRPRSPN